MKQLTIIAAFITLCSVANAQSGTGQDTTKNRQPQSAYGFDWNNGAFMYTFVPPKDTLKLRVRDSGAIAYKNLRYWSWSGYRWDTLRATGGGSSITPIMYTAGRGLGLYANQFRLGGEADSTIALNMQGETFVVDNADSISIGTLRSGTYGSVIVEIAGQGKVLLNSAGPIQLSGSSLDASGSPTGQLGNRLTYGTNDVSITNVPIRLSPISVEPSGLNGYIYYNSSLNKFRVYANGSWQDMAVGSPAVPTLQQVLTAGSDISGIDNAVNLGGKFLDFNILNGVNPYTKIRLGRNATTSESISITGKTLSSRRPLMSFKDEDFPGIDANIGLGLGQDFNFSRSDGSNSSYLSLTQVGDAKLYAFGATAGSTTGLDLQGDGVFNMYSLGTHPVFGGITTSVTSSPTNAFLTHTVGRDDAFYSAAMRISADDAQASFFGGSYGGVAGFPEHGFATYPGVSTFYIDNMDKAVNVDANGPVMAVGASGGFPTRYAGLNVGGQFFVGNNSTPTGADFLVNSGSVQVSSLATASANQFVKPNASGVLGLASAVTAVGILSSNGFTINVSNPTTTPTFTLTTPTTAGNIFFGTGTGLGNNNNFSFNTTNTTLGIGMGASASNSNAKLHVLGSGVAPAITALFEGTAGGDDGGAKIKLGKDYNGAGVAAGDQLYKIESHVKGFGPILGATSYIRTVATQAHSLSATGTIMAFGNSAHGTASVTERFRLDSIGGVSVGATFGGANLSVAPGIARPLFRLKSSNAITAPSNVDFAYSGNNLQVTPDAGKVQLRAGLSASYGTPVVSVLRNFSDEGNSTTTNTALHSYTLPANLLAFDSATVSFEFAGTWFGSTSSKTTALEFNGTQIFSTGVLPVGTTVNFEIKGYIVRTSSSTAKVVASLYSNGVLTGYQSLTSLDFTTTKVLRVMGQASGTGAASNDIVVNISRIMQSN